MIQPFFYSYFFLLRYTFSKSQSQRLTDSKNPLNTNKNKTVNCTQTKYNVYNIDYVNPKILKKNRKK